MLKNALAAAGLLALAPGCIDPVDPSTSTPHETILFRDGYQTRIYTWVDQKRGVTCWILDGCREKSISCLPTGSLPLGANQ